MRIVIISWHFIAINIDYTKLIVQDETNVSCGMAWHSKYACCKHSISVYHLSFVIYHLDSERRKEFEGEPEFNSTQALEPMHAFFIHSDWFSFNSSSFVLNTLNLFSFALSQFFLVSLKKLMDFNIVDFHLYIENIDDFKPLEKKMFFFFIFVKTLKF